MGLNWIDGIIFVVVAGYAMDGWFVGGLALISSLVGFVGGLWLAVRYHQPAGEFLAQKFGLPGVWADVLGYVVVAIGGEVALSVVAEWVAVKLPQKAWSSRINRIAGAIISTIKGVVVVTFVMLVILALPIRGTVKRDIKNSQVGSVLVRYAEKYGGEAKSSLDQAVATAVKFLTVKPASGETLSLAELLPDECDLLADTAAEEQMLQLVNAERRKAGAKTLVVDAKIVQVAEKHSRDMLVRKYFSHISPEGKDIGLRLAEGGVKYMLAGENIAIAPDVETAHEGLMNSEGHRRNILEVGFGRVGIGVVDGGSCGMMFTQNFGD